MRYEIKTFKIRLAVKEPPGQVLNNPGKVVDVARAVFRDLDADQEHFVMFGLNIQNELIGFKVCSSGTIDQVAVYPRIIMRNALLMGAAAIIIVHNHPSGHIDPSDEDKRLTKQIGDVGRVLDVRLLDHLIISEKQNYFSFTESGLL